MPEHPSLRLLKAKPGLPKATVPSMSESSHYPDRAGRTSASPTLTCNEKPFLSQRTKPRKIIICIAGVATKH